MTEFHAKNCKPPGSRWLTLHLMSCVRGGAPWALGAGAQCSQDPGPEGAGQRGRFVRVPLSSSRKTRDRPSRVLWDSGRGAPPLLAGSPLELHLGKPGRRRTTRPSRTSAQTCGLAVSLGASSVPVSLERELGASPRLSASNRRRTVARCEPTSELVERIVPCVVLRAGHHWGRTAALRLRPFSRCISSLRPRVSTAWAALRCRAPVFSRPGR